MKKYFLIIMLLGLALVPTLSLAADAPACTPGFASSSSGGTLCNALPSFFGVAITDVRGFMVALLIWGGTVIATLTIIMFIYAGARMIIARGDPGAIKEAKQTFYYTLIGFVVSLFSYLIISSLEFFLGVNAGSPTASFFFNPLGAPNLMTLVQETVSGFLVLVGSIAILFIIVAGFRYMIAGGSEEQITKAKSSITWAVIGLLCVLLAYTIFQVINESIGGIN